VQFWQREPLVYKTDGVNFSFKLVLNFSLKPLFKTEVNLNIGLKPVFAIWFKLKLWFKLLV